MCASNGIDLARAVECSTAAAGNCESETTYGKERNGRFVLISNHDKSLLRQQPGVVPVATSGEKLIKCAGCQWLSISLGEDKVVCWVKLNPPLFQEGFQFWVDVRGYDHGGPFPVGFAGLVVGRAVANDPAALLIFEEGLSHLKLTYGALPGQQEWRT